AIRRRGRASSQARRASCAHGRAPACRCVRGFRIHRLNRTLCRPRKSGPVRVRERAADLAGLPMGCGVAFREGAMSTSFPLATQPCFDMKVVMRDALVSIAKFSQIVESIYDCALDPDRWPEAIRAVCEAASCVAGILNVSDLSTGISRLQQHW